MHSIMALLLALTAGDGSAARLLSVTPLDREYLIVNFADGEVVHEDEINKIDRVDRYDPELATREAMDTANWTISSADDPDYLGTGQTPLSCFRKKKLNGHAESTVWDAGAGSYGDWVYESTYEHWVYLELPEALKEGATYELAIGAAVNSDTTEITFTFDSYTTVSEAIHVNLAGYHPDAPHKAADLYYWMGDGGGRNYSGFEGAPVVLYNVNDQTTSQVGTVQFWKPSGGDVFNFNLTGSDVWNIDFSTVSTPGTYRLVVEGIGCSQDFEIFNNAYHDPFAVSVRGYYYMRMGEDNPNSLYPPPRTPLYIPGRDNTTVFLTTMHPYHSEWDNLTSGDKWDKEEAWVPYVKTTTPNTNPEGWGGHSDAADEDRHLGHVVNIYAMLLPYIMSNGVLNDDDLGITESSNGIPDIIDEARWEVDFWLRLRDGAGYSHGLTNSNNNKEFFQAAPTPIAAWANAANAAMLSDAFRIAGNSSLMAQYRDAAIEAFTVASGYADQMLDEALGFDEGKMRGRDLKMTAAAYLYNVTGDTEWEDVIFAESSCAGIPATIQSQNGLYQLFGVAGYLMTPQAVHYQAMYDNMKNQIINEAKSTEADLMYSRPSRRTTYNPPAYWRTAQVVNRTIVAHAVTDNPAEKNYFRKALALEADWALGRNPMNIIEMTTAHTPLESKRSVPEAYTSGMYDGAPGVHPGHTPYINLWDWGTPGQSMTMSLPSELYKNSYPKNVMDTWAIGETYFPSRWVYAHNEFTPRQTMKDKLALHGYLHSLSKASAPPGATLSVEVADIAGGGGTITAAGITCGSDCSESYTPGTAVTLTAEPDGNSRFAGWSGACFGSSQTCQLTMAIDQMVTARFEPIGHTYELSVALEGNGTGTVSSAPAGISCPADCSSNFSSATSVILTPEAETGNHFVGWGGACSGAGECEITMSADKTVTATFRSDSAPEIYIYDDALASGWVSWSWGGAFDFSATSPVHTGSNSMTATLNGYGGLSPATSGSGFDTYGYDALSFWIHGGDESKQLQFTTESDGEQSTPVTITAVANNWTEVVIPFTDLGSPETITRLNWFNNSQSGISRFAVDDVKLVPENLPGPQKPLSTTVDAVTGSSGTITSAPAGIDCGGDCYELFDNDTVVTLSATPDAGSVFLNWSGDCTGAGTTCEVVLGTNRYVTAHFEPEGHTWSLDVNKTGQGDGTITSEPAGIECGGTCTSAFPSQSTVTLSAAADSESLFTGWQGACSGTGTCTVEMTGDLSVTAEFRLSNVPELVIYDDALASGWYDASWGSTRNLAATDPVRDGSTIVNISSVNAWAGFQPALSSGSIETYGYNGLHFWIHGGSGSDKYIRVYFQLGSEAAGTSKKIDVPAGVWTEFFIPLEEFGSPEYVSTLTFQNFTNAQIDGFSVDDIRLIPADLIPVTGVTVNPTSGTIDGGTLLLIATVEPENASNKSVTWSSSNAAIASVNSYGQVIGHAAGTATITATTDEGAFQASAGITVASPTQGRIIKVMPLGDSITEGYTIGGAYRLKLWQNLENAGLECGVDLVGSLDHHSATGLDDPDHEGHSGWTTGMILENIDNYMAAATPDIVMMHLGTNDIAQEVVDQAPANLRSLIDHITAALPEDGKLYVAKIIPMGGIGNPDSINYNTIIEAAVTEKQNEGLPVFLVDAYSIWPSGSSYYISDWTHPNQQGYDALGDFWFDVIEADVQLPCAGVSIDPGDVDGDGSVTLSDAINALKVTVNSSATATSEADVNGDSRIGLEEAIKVLQDMPSPGQGCEEVENPEESFDTGDAPESVLIPSASRYISTPWGYSKAGNQSRLYPVVVNGCWGEGGYFTTEIRKKYPAFYLEYQQCDSDADGANLAGIIDAAVDQGLRIDENRIYLTGFSKGGSGSYKLIRGFLSEDKIFAGLIRLAGQSESVLPDEAVAETSIWYHIGTSDVPARVTVAQQAYDFVKNHSYNSTAVETSEADTFTGFPRTTKTLTKDGMEIMKYSVYDGMGHITGPPYSDPALFDWLFSQSRLCR